LSTGQKSSPQRHKGHKEAFEPQRHRGHREDKGQKNERDEDANRTVPPASFFSFFSLSSLCPLCLCGSNASLCPLCLCGESTDRGCMMDLIARAAEGFRGVEADEALKERALKYLRQWLTEAEFAAYRPQLEWLIAERQWAGLLDRFCQVLPFGTGGRRGPVG